MSFRLVRLLFVTAALTASPLAAVAAAATPALPAYTGCPSDRSSRSTTWASYGVPFQIDAAGNHDGPVCGVPLPEAYREVHAPAAAVPVIYLFRDNT